ncbi:hypothetical protein N7462_009950 [Penicillium macrosclerotiorum]|uniref:uncharacterized protein n=1 Tax=Penicillium macrosclerotiorum TaxID=303699 RepID=UPI002546ED6C|nr:uncharacterized protein N7462_009950 [Penicillium macrosclerotiorum]KAJ5668880.1 hypothetical protein N7462_009950 [Penicillium macrosclerotiorum]
MKDAPSALLSPYKISREREIDLDEEPAAKRTKVKHENSTIDLKLFEFPTPSAETSGPVAAPRKSTVSKI